MSVKPTNVTDELYGYLLEHFSSEDEFLRNLRVESVEQGIPEICISPEQGRFLQFFLKAIGAKNVLEIGSLAGYSAITMGRALPENGKLITVEVKEQFCKFINEKVKEDGLESKVKVVNADALVFLDEYKPDSLFDFIFIDAEKPDYIKLFDKAEKLLRVGGVLAADNALAFGELLSEVTIRRPIDVNGVRDFNMYLKNHPRFFTSLATMGDGMLMCYKLK